MEIAQLISEYGVLGLLCYFAIKEFFNYLGKKDSKPEKFGVYEGKVDMQVGILTTKEQRNENDILEMKTNHLKHQEKIEVQMEQNAKEHQEIFITLGEIKSLLLKKK